MVAAPLLPETLETEKPAKGKGRMNTIPKESDESFLNELLIAKLSAKISPRHCVGHKDLHCEPVMLEKVQDHEAT